MARFDNGERPVTLRSHQFGRSAQSAAQNLVAALPRCEHSRRQEDLEMILPDIPRQARFRTENDRDGRLDVIAPIWITTGSEVSSRLHEEGMHGRR